MAYKHGNERQEIIKDIKRNERGEYIRVSRIIPNEANRLESVDIRIMYTADDGKLRPTQKGVRVNSELIVELALAIIQAMKSDEKSDFNSLYEDMDAYEYEDMDSYEYEDIDGLDDI